MKVDKDTLNYLAKLAKLNLEEGEKDQLLDDLNNILAFVEQLKEVDTSDVEPLIFINETAEELRDDVVVYQITQMEALSNAPMKNDDYFLVPKVIG
jgi:aspartyl-tRNA(Asn)/glutamyl-tRNA(Gln) amidotransferase subunit C